MEITIPWTNDIICYARQFPRNPKGQYQTEKGGAIASATPKAGIEIGTLPVGAKVKLTINNAGWDFLVVHQGNPDAAMYDASCDGTWLLMQDCYENRQWHSAVINNYASSEIHAYLYNTFFALLDIKAKNKIRYIKIPYGTGSDMAVNSGSDG